jgi:hypothetical protein
MSIRTVVITQVLISIGVVVAFVFCESMWMRGWMGAGILTTLTPLTIRWSVRKTQKISQDEGRIFELADLMTEYAKNNG